jgi:DNA-binding SARP family transcriptional activator
VAPARDTQRISLKLLGPFEATLAARDRVGIHGRKAQALLAYLALLPGRRVPRETLIGILWDETEPPAARNSLRQLLFSLRRTLREAARDVLVVKGDVIGLDEAVEVDVGAFERGVADASPAAVAAAVDLYRGELLEGLTLDEPVFEDWLGAERDRLRGLLRGALGRLATHQARAGNADAAIEWAQRLLADDPLDEAVHRLLMRLHAEHGRQAAALRQYQACLEVLRRELGVQPDEETRALYRRLLAERRAGPPGRSAVSAFASDPTPLIGRERERAALHAALDAAWGGEAQIVAIEGDAGIGKSRLLRELAAEAERRGGRVIVGTCHEAERILPFHPWAAAIRHGRLLEASEEARALPPALRLELAALFPELEPGGAPPRPKEEAALQLLEAVSRLLLGVARERMLVVLIEDLHWSDAMSVRLLSFLSRRIAGARLLIAFTARDEDTADVPLLRALLVRLDREGRLRRLALSPLGRAETEALVRTLVSSAFDPPVLAGLGDSAWTASEGNPFVAVEVVQTWREGPADGPSLALPRRVHELIAARLDGLSAPAQEMTSLAAVMDEDVDFALLAHASGLSEAPAAETLEELVRRRILHGVGERFAFVHDRIRGVAAQRLLPPRLRLLHRRIAESMEALYPEDVTSRATALGHHYRAAEVWDRALVHLRRAGALAFARGAHREAGSSFELAIAALERLPDTEETRRLGVDLRVDLRHSLLPLAEFDKLGVHLHAAERLATELGDRARLGRVLAFLGNHYWWLGDLARGEDYCRRALAIAREDGDMAAAALAAMYLGLVSYGQGQYAEGARIFRRIAGGTGDAARLERVGLPGFIGVYARAYLCLCLTELGEFEEGYAVAEETVPMAEALGHPSVLVHACLARCCLGVRRGDFDLVERAAAWYQSVQGIGAEVWPIADWWIAHARTLAGDVKRALPALEAVTEPVTPETALTARPMVSMPMVTTWLAEVYLLAGRDKDAAFVNAQALDLAHGHGRHGAEAWALRFQGDLAARVEPPDVDRAEASYRRALAMAHERGMRPLEARCLLDLGRLHARVERPVEARQALHDALAIFEALGMTRWVPEAESALASLGFGSAGRDAHKPPERPW